jgi:tripartite tricarboxylate transporter family receptor
MMRLFARTPIAFFVLMIFIYPAKTSAEEPFYKGKTITILAGTGAGNVYDLYARLFARHLSKYIPGNPDIIVQNMPGAASMIAANHLYQLSKPDGLTIGAIFPALYFDQLVGRSEVQFDWSKFIWLGSPVKSEHLFYMRADSPYKSVHDIVKTSNPPKCGATGTASTAYYIPKLLDQIIGTDFNVILGYKTGTDIDLAVERGEAICRAFTITAFFAREPFFTWMKKKFVRILVQSGKKRDRRIWCWPAVSSAVRTSCRPIPQRIGYTLSARLSPRRSRTKPQLRMGNRSNWNSIRARRNPWKRWLRSCQPTSRHCRSDEEIADQMSSEENSLQEFRFPAADESLRR